MSPFEPNYRGPGEGPRGPFQAFFNPSGASPRKSASGSSLQHQHLAQIVTHPLEPKMIVVAHITEVATSLQPVTAFQGADDSLHGRRTREKNLFRFFCCAVMAR